MPARTGSRRALLVLMAMAVAMIGGGIGCLVWHASSSADAARYRDAVACGAPGQTGSDCIQVVTLRITDRSREFASSGTRYDLSVILPDATTATVELVGSARQDVWNSVSAPMSARAVLWHGRVTEVDLPTAGVDTADNPLYLTSFTLYFGITLLVMGGLYLLSGAQAWRRATRRAQGTGDGGLVTAPAPGAVGLPPGFGLDRVLTYRPVSSWYSAILQASAIEFVVCVGALRFGADPVTIAVVVWAAVPLAALYVWWVRGYELTLTDNGLRYRSPRGGFTAPWSQVRLVRRSGQPSLRVEVGGRTRRVGLLLFTRRNPANGGLLRQVQMRLERAGTGGAVVPEASPPKAVLGVGTRRRLGAWAIDAVVVLVLGFVGITLLVAAAGGHPSDGLDVAIVFGAPALVLLAYLLPLWRRGRTLGMAVLRLRLVDAETGGRPGWRQLWLRFILVLPWVCTVVPIGTLIGGRRPQYDRLAGTVLRAA